MRKGNRRRKDWIETPGEKNKQKQIHNTSILLYSPKQKQKQKKKFIRNNRNIYFILLTMTWAGAPVLTVTGTVVVLVQDVNDHTPELSQGRYQSDVVENGPAGQAVVQVCLWRRENI